MTEEEKIKEEILNWINQNQNGLPLNVDHWQINVFQPKNNGEEKEAINLGKYDAALNVSHPFYKPYSKMFSLKNGQ